MPGLEVEASQTYEQWPLALSEVLRFQSRRTIAIISPGALNRSRLPDPTQEADYSCVPPSFTSLKIDLLTKSDLELDKCPSHSGIDKWLMFASVPDGCKINPLG